jgi:hypothetical protein
MKVYRENKVDIFPGKKIPANFSTSRFVALPLSRSSAAVHGTRGRSGGLVPFYNIRTATRYYSALNYFVLVLILNLVLVLDLVLFPPRYNEQRAEDTGGLFFYRYFTPMFVSFDQAKLIKRSFIYFELDLLRCQFFFRGWSGGVAGAESPEKATKF